MSVQLVVYPQWYDGVPSAVSSTPVSTAEMLSNPADFVAVASGTTLPASVTTAVMTQYAIDNFINLMLTNTWYGFAQNLGLIFGSTNVGINDGLVVQKISNLVVGGLYDVKVTWTTSVTPALGKIKIYDGTILQSQHTAIPDANNEATVQFTATSSDAIVVFERVGALTEIASISVKGAPVQPPTAIQVLDNGQVICDLYEDEDIPLTFSIDNFKNAAEQVHSYSKAFNLPGTKRNNQIFDNMFEVTRYVDGRSIQFNPLVRTQAVLKQNGILLFEGFLRMLDISEKEGEISYNVNLYSEVIALADTLKDRKFNQLDFSELDHEYDIDNIIDSWTGVLPLLNPLPVGTFAGTAGASTTAVLKYPFADWNHQFTVDATSGNPVLPNLESAFRPFIQLKYIINMIFNSTEFTYTSSFFNTSGFERLYMDFNWGAGNSPVTFDLSTTLQSTAQALTTSFTNLNFLDPGNIPASFGYSSGVFTAQQDGQIYNPTSYVYFESGVSSTTLDIQLLVNGVVSNAWTANVFGSSIFVWNGLNNTTITLQTGETWSIQAKYTGGAGISMGVVVGNPALTVTTSADEFTNETILETLRGDLGQWEFFKGIMTMFNLVSMPNPDNPNDLIIEPYSDVFVNDGIGFTAYGTDLAARGIERDWTEKIDVAQMKLEPLADLKSKVIFQYAEDDDDFCFSEYKRQIQPLNIFEGSGHLYGSKVWDARDLTLLEGEETISAEPFAATIPAPLEPQYTDFIIPKIYAKEGRECEGFDNAPRILYDNGVHTLTSCTYAIPEQNGGSAVAAQASYLRFTHLTDVPTTLGDTFDYNFGACQLLPGLGVPVAANLFNIYWLPYYQELYNPNTRTMTIKVNLGAGDISTFQFNDKVMIKNRAYRVNKIDYKPNDLSNVEFILIG